MFVYANVKTLINTSKVKMINVLKSKFRGCLIGCLLGDCMGAPFEGDALSAGAKIIIQNYFDKLDGPHFRGGLTQRMYNNL